MIPAQPDRNDYPDWNRVRGKFYWYRHYGRLSAEIRQGRDGRYRSYAAGSIGVVRTGAHETFEEARIALEADLERACRETLIKLETLRSA